MSLDERRISEPAQEYTDSESSKQNEEKTFQQMKLHETKNRWNSINLGLLQTVISSCFKNVSEKTSIILTIASNIIFSIFDTCSDLAVAYTLFYEDEWEYAMIVLILDYIPGWQLLIHNLCSKNWNLVENTRAKYITVVFLLVSPFSLPLFFLRWLLAFETSDTTTFIYLHHNTRLSQLLNGSVESPLQVVMLIVLWAEKKLPLPWSEGYQYIDPQGNVLDFGILPGILSLIMSSLVIIKGSLETAESSNFYEIVLVAGYAFCNFFYRLSSFALAVIYFKLWSIILFVSIAIVNVICILRYDVPKRADFSVVTSAVISMFTPFVSSDQTHEAQTKNKTYQNQTRKINATHKRKLSAHLALCTFPLILASDIALYFILQYHNDFKYGEIILNKETTLVIMQMLIFPSAISAMVASLIFHKRTVQNTTENRLIGSIEGVYQKIRRTCYHSVRYLIILLSVLLILVMGSLTIQKIQRLEFSKDVQVIDSTTQNSCNCLELLSKVETGNCENLWRDNLSDNVKLWCYIANPSNCSDQQVSEFHSGRIWSYHGCEQRRISGGCCENIMHVDCLSCISRRSKNYSCGKEPRLVGCPKDNTKAREVSNTCFEKKNGVHCLVDDSLTLPNQTLVNALAKCASDSNCEKVFDDKCDGSGRFLLCERGKAEFTSTHLDFSEKWAIFMSIYGTQFSNTVEENQILAASCLYSKSNKINCPWKYQTTKQHDILLCNDGYACHGQTHPEGYGCCNRHSGRALCMKNSPIMCNFTGCGKSEEFPDGDYCCENKENCEVGRPCDTTKKIQPKVQYRCPWKHDATPRQNLWKCSDGHYCNIFDDPLQEACCKNHGGLSVCPSNYPVMCDKPLCANETDYCCEGSKEDCKKKYGGKERPCEIIADDVSNDNSVMSPARIGDNGGGKLSKSENIKVKGCSNGDVKFDLGSTPMIFWNSTWSPICGHHFWNDDNGATKFCEKLGCYFGGTVTPFLGNYTAHDGNVSYDDDALLVGRCHKDDAWGECSGGCNGEEIGGRCHHGGDFSEACRAGQPVRINITCHCTCTKESSC